MSKKELKKIERSEEGLSETEVGFNYNFTKKKVEERRVTELKAFSRKLLNNQKRLSKLKQERTKDMFKL